MTLHLWFKNGTGIVLTCVESLVMVGYDEFSVKCFGNDAVIHRGVSAIAIVNL